MQIANPLYNDFHIGGQQTHTQEKKKKVIQAIYSAMVKSKCSVRGPINLKQASHNWRM